MIKKHKLIPNHIALKKLKFNIGSKILHVKNDFYLKGEIIGILNQQRIYYPGKFFCEKYISYLILIEECSNDKFGSIPCDEQICSWYNISLSFLNKPVNFFKLHEFEIINLNTSFNSIFRNFS